VLAEMSGSADTTTLPEPSSSGISSAISGSGENGLQRGRVTFGSTTVLGASSYLVDAPHYFGTGVFTTATTASGDVGGLNVTIFGDSLLLPPGYVSGTQLSSRSVWRDQSFASLGLAPGVYEVFWPTDNLILYIGQTTGSTHSVGGTVTGLAGSVTLQLNGGNDYIVTTNGSFMFPTLLEDTSDYEVTVSVQPDGQVCNVENGTGIIEKDNVSDVVIDCAASYAVSGTISGLSGTTTLRLNGDSFLEVSSNGPFGPFPDEVRDNESYSVSVFIRPPNQTCTVENGSGIIDGADITDISVVCEDNPFMFSVSGTITGLDGTVVLQLNGADDLTVTSNGPWGPFASLVPTDSPYEVTVLTHPDSQVCLVENCCGVIWNFDIMDVLVTCQTYVQIFTDGFDN